MANRPRKRQRSRRSSRFASWWVLWRVPTLIAVLSAAWWFLYRPYVHEQGWVQVTERFALCGEPWAGASGCVVDGDTLVIGNGGDRRRIRLIGFDAPELKGACPAESAQAARARLALYQWLGEGAFEWNGADNPPRDKYGRELREARRAGPGKQREYLAEVMIERGLAAANGWSGEPIDWCT